MPLRHSLSWIWQNLPAMKMHKAIIQLYPENAYAFRNRGMINVGMDKNTEGCADFKQALNLGFTEKYDSEVEEFYKPQCSVTKF